MKRILYRIRFALALTDRDLENIIWLCDKAEEDRVVNARFRDELHGLHDLAVEAASWA
jgi:hypothetical protein